ncbi:MAG: tetratricopeptide repeat protein [Chloroflexaceae bacterium]|nr:tetratricopeptide repeat protein [Chloroflexaceae bacterium]
MTEQPATAHQPAQGDTQGKAQETTTPFSVPSSFLPPHPPLVGRDCELENIRQRLCDSPSASVRLALEGVAGVGKTCLAIVLAYDPQVRDCFPGGVLVANPGQHAAFISRVAREPDPRSEPCLLIMDDIRSVEDIQPFLNARPHISLLLTCRQCAPLPQATRRDLDHLIGPENLFPIEPLSDTHATDLLRQSAGIPAPDGQEELEVLAALAGGLPLLLTLLGGYLRHQRQAAPEAWFAQAIEDLKEAAKRLSLPTSPIEQAGRVARRGFLSGLFGKPPSPKPLSPKVILDLSVGTLPRHMQMDAIRVAALLPDPLSFDHATAHAVAEPTDERSFSVLVERNVLRETGDGRLCIHQALCEWAEAEKRFYSEVRSAHRRLIAYHLDRFSPNNAAALAHWQEHPDNWQQMLRTWEEATADPALLQTCLTTMVRPLIEQGYHDEVRAGLVHALSLFREDSLLLGLANYDLGLIAYARAVYEQAVEYAEAALLHFQIAHEEKEQGMALTLLGQIARTRGDHPAARRYLEEVLLITPEADEVNYAVSLLNLAVVLMEQQDYHAARPLFERSLALHRRVFGANHPRTLTIRHHLASLPETGPPTDPPTVEHRGNGQEAATAQPSGGEQSQQGISRKAKTTTRKGTGKSGRRGPRAK